MTSNELTCQELVELVTDYIEGALSAADKARFEFHIADCAGCTAYLAQMQTTIRLVGRLREQDAETASAKEMLRVFQDWKSNTRPS